MEIYDFYFAGNGNRVVKSVLEAVEKPKTYVTTTEYGTRRIKKAEIGRVGPFDHVLLLEDDEKKARETFCKKLNDDISRSKKRIDTEEKEIERMENRIKELSGGRLND